MRSRAEDYARVGPSVYAKGHLKRYAALLGLPAAEIMAAYESRAQAPQPPVSQPANVRAAYQQCAGREQFTLAAHRGCKSRWSCWSSACFGGSRGTNGGAGSVPRRAPWRRIQGQPSADSAFGPPLRRPQGADAATGAAGGRVARDAADPQQQRRWRCRAAAATVPPVPATSPEPDATAGMGPCPDSF